MNTNNVGSPCDNGRTNEGPRIAPETPPITTASRGDVMTENDSTPSLHAHAFEAFDGASGYTCTAPVMRDGGGDLFGLPPKHGLHTARPDKARP